MYPDAVKYVRESSRASVAALQRKLMIGYNRAARIVEHMEISGVVSSMDSQGTRVVLPV
nr:DNA translocase FtsK [Stutzerimonas xanthomarina]